MSEHLNAVWRWAWLVLALCATAYAQASMSDYNGVYVYRHHAGDEAHTRASIEHATESLGLMQRSIARKRLNDSTKPFPRFQVFFEGERVLIRIMPHEFNLPLDGHPIRAEGLTGTDVRVSATLRGETLHQVFRGDKGTRHLVYEFHHDGTVTLKTTIESEYLPYHIDYVLTYGGVN